MLPSIPLWRTACKVMSVNTTLLVLVKNLLHLCRTYKSQVYHSGTWWAAINLKLPQAVRRSSWSKWKWDGAILADNMRVNTRWRGRKAETELHEINTSQTCDWWFPCSWGKSNHAWMSLLIGPMLPLNHQKPASLTFLWVVTKFKGLLYWEIVLYPSVHK